jgi:hypothetical protein
LYFSIQLYRCFLPKGEKNARACILACASLQYPFKMHGTLNSAFLYAVTAWCLGTGILLFL